MFGSKAKDKRTSTSERREKDRISLLLVQEKEEKKTKGEKGGRSPGQKGKSW
jgi:hypothetical protein